MLSRLLLPLVLAFVPAAALAHAAGPALTPIASELTATLADPDPTPDPATLVAPPTLAESVTVSAHTSEIALAQLQLAERQRVLGIVPNFYASYVWDAAPLTRRQKYSLAWRFATDPTTFAFSAAIAASEQFQGTFPGYGRGPLGYSRRLGSTYADAFSSTMLGQAVFPALLHQDPRYFVKPTGSVAARAAYALANTVLCRGDNGHWQLNASNLAGNLSSAALSNLYYPASSRRGVSLTLNTALLTTASGALGNLMQQFVLRHLTPNVPAY